MRIVGGRLRGRPLGAPAGPDTRPTSDRAREAVFNILAHGIADFDIEGLAVVDVFAGTGAMGLEALSRGAARATFIDNSGEALRRAKENAARLGVWRETTLLKLDATRPPPPPRPTGAPCGLAFLDAPYGRDLTVPALLGLSARGWLADGALCVVEVAAEERFEPPRAFAPLDARTYGAARVVFLRHHPAG